MPNIYKTVVTLACLLFLGACTTPTPTIHGQTPGNNASSPGQAPHEPASNASDTDLEVTPAPIIPTPSERSSDWKQYVENGDFGKHLLSKISSENIIDEDDVSGWDWVWNHVARYDGKHQILAAAYATGQIHQDSQRELKLFTGSLETLGADLAKNDEAPYDACLDYYEGHPQVWVLTDDGAAYQVRWPRDGCEHNMRMDTDYPFVPRMGS